MHAADAKTQKIKPDPKQNLCKQNRQCVNVIDTTWGHIYFFYMQKFRTQCAETLTLLKVSILSFSKGVLIMIF